MPDKESTGTAGATQQHWRQRFVELVDQWKRERGPHSSSAELARHPAYQQIIEMGQEAIPLLLSELEREPDHWFRALYAITGVNPVPAASRGKVREMADAWILWGREQGYR